MQTSHPHPLNEEKSNFICSNHEIHDNGDAGYGRCYKVSAYYHPSYSPGFEFDYSRGSFVITNPNLGTWATVMYVSFSLPSPKLALSYSLPRDLDVNSYLIKVTSTRYQLLQLAIGIFKILGTIALLILFKWKRKAIRRIASNANRVADRGNGVSPQSVNPAIHI